MLSRFFQAQCSEPIKGDWVSTVKSDLEYLDVKLSFEEISKYSKQSFKTLVKDSVKAKAFKELVGCQKKHSKGKEIVYRDLGLQNYLKAASPLSIDEKRFLFAARTRGLRLENNFKQGKQDLRCRLCKDHIEDQQSLLSCSALKHIKSPAQTEYNDIFSDNMDKLTAIAKLLKNLPWMCQN